MQRSPEATTTPFLLDKLHGSSLGASFACGFPQLCLSLGLAEGEPAVLGSWRGGQSRGHRKGTAKRREQEVGAVEWETLTSSGFSPL